MTKIAIKSDKITPFGGIFSIMQQFDRSLSQVIDSTLGVRCKFYGYQYSEILRSLMCIYFCGGSCVEDLSSHLINHLSLHPKLRTCSADTILRAISELAQSNISYACKLPVNHVFSATSSTCIFVPKNEAYDDTRRSCRNYYVLQGTQSNL